MTHRSRWTSDAEPIDPTDHSPWTTENCYLPTLPVHQRIYFWQGRDGCWRTGDTQNHLVHDSHEEAQAAFIAIRMGGPDG